MPFLKTKTTLEEWVSKTNGILNPVQVAQRAQIVQSYEGKELRELLKSWDTQENKESKAAIQSALNWIDTPQGEDPPKSIILQTEADLPIWGTALKAIRHQNPPREDNLYKKLFLEILNHRQIQQEKARMAIVLGTEAPGENTRLQYGGPESWFYYNRGAELINIDLEQMLILGKGPTRAITLHEIGHAIETVDFMEPIKSIKNRADALHKKGKTPPGMTKEEYKEFSILHRKIQTIHNLCNAFEDNCVNAFAVKLPQSSSNYNWTLKEATNDSRRIVEAPQPTEEDPNTKAIEDLLKLLEEKGNKTDQTRAIEIQEELQVLGHQVNMSFYIDNGLTSDTDESWNMLKINPPEKEIRDWCKSAQNLLSFAHTDDPYQRLDPKKWKEKRTEIFHKREEIFLELYNTKAKDLVEELMKIFERNFQFEKKKGEGKCQGEPLYVQGMEADDPSQDSPSQPGEDKEHKGDSPDKSQDNDQDWDTPQSVKEAQEQESKRIEEEEAKRIKSLQEALNQSHGGGGFWELDELTLGNVEDYQKAKEEMAPLIQFTKTSIIRALNRAIEQKYNESDLQKTFSGAGINKRKNTLFLKETLKGQTPEEEVKHRFKTKVPSPHIKDQRYLIVIDGSGSMIGENWKRSITSAFVLGESLQQAGKTIARNTQTKTNPIATYVLISGPDKGIPTLETPKMDSKTKMERYAGALQQTGIGGCREFWPALQEGIRAIHNDKPDQNTKTNVLFITDGGMWETEKIAKEYARLKKSQEINCSFICMSPKKEYIQQINKLLQENHKIPTRDLPTVHQTNDSHDGKGQTILSTTIQAIKTQIQKDRNLVIDPNKEQKKRRKYLQEIQEEPTI